MVTVAATLAATSLERAFVVFEVEHQSEGTDGSLISELETDGDD